jgi:ABC-type branched-subunit amino acid transport system ATPase component
VLEINDCSIHFGGIKALDHVDLLVPEGEIRGVIGPNGSGKTTLLNIVSGLYPVDSGNISLFGHDITHRPAHEVSRLGLARTFQNLQLVNNLTVLENVMLGLCGSLRTSLCGIVIRSRKFRREEKEAERRAREALRFVDLEFLADRRGDELSGGQMRLVEFARALVSKPRILLLDEPAAGLSLVRIDAIQKLISRTSTELGVTIILVEHVLNLVMTLSHKVTVLQSGSVLCEGSPEEVRSNESVCEAYLGRSERQ